MNVKQPKRRLFSTFLRKGDHSSLDERRSAQALTVSAARGAGRASAFSSQACQASSKFRPPAGQPWTPRQGQRSLGGSQFFQGRISVKRGCANQRRRNLFQCGLVLDDGLAGRGQFPRRTGGPAHPAQRLIGQPGGKHRHGLWLGAAGVPALVGVMGSGQVETTSEASVMPRAAYSPAGSRVSSMPASPAA